MKKFSQVVKGLCFAILILSFTSVSLFADNGVHPIHANAVGFGSRGMEDYDNTTPEVQQTVRWQRMLMGWHNFEPTHNNYDYDRLRADIQRCTSKGIYVFLDPWTGYNAPEWLYSAPHNVPHCVTLKGEAEKKWPDYDNAVYVAEHNEMFDKLFDYIANTLPAADRELVFCIGINLGKTNDFQAIGGSLVSGNSVFNEWQGNHSKWVTYSKSRYTTINNNFVNNYLSKLPHVRLSYSMKGWNERADSSSFLTWMKNNLYKPWSSIGHPGKIYMGTDEKLNWDYFGANFLWSKQDGEYPFNRNEIHKASTKGKCYFDYIVWHQYWFALFNLHWGTGLYEPLWSADVWENPVATDNLVPAWEFLNFYAGQKDVAHATGAFVALRDGLDAADTSRFPTDKYGGTSNRKNRVSNILQDFQSRGATQGRADLVDTVPHAGNSTFGNEISGVLNDVGWNVIAGCYKMHIDLMNPEDGIGFWQVGPVTQMYGRYAMGINNQSGSNKLYFDLDDGLFSGGVNNCVRQAKIIVTYFDEGTSTFELRYDSLHDSDKTALTITKTNSGEWRQVDTGFLSDAYFGDRAENNSDIYLYNPDTETDKFHMIDVRFLDVPPPNPPSGLTASYSATTIALDWDDNVEADLEDYKIYRATVKGGPYTQLAANILDSEYEDTTASSGVDYYYVVTAFNTSQVESGFSNEVQALLVLPNPDNPTGLTATPSETEIVLDWNDNTEPDLVSYKVYRSTTDSGPYTEKASGLTVSNYTDTTAVAGTTYYYVVTAVDIDTYESENSLQIETMLLSSNPDPPIGLIATPSASDIALDWDDNTESDLASYKVFRSTAPGEPYIQIASGLTSSAYTDSTAAQDVVYYYTVKAVDTTAYESAFSDEVSGMRIPPVTTVSFSPSDDTYVNENSKDSTYGNSTVLQVRGNGSRDRIAFIKFNVTGITGTVTSAKLKIYSEDCTQTVTAKQVALNDWTETGLTWNNMPSRSTTMATQSISTGWNEINVASYVTGNGIYSMALEGNANNTERFTSDEAGTANKPVLEIIFETGMPSPEGLTSTSTETQISLDWDDLTDPALDYYKVYRGTAVGGPYSQIATNVITSAYVDSTGVFGTDYYYVVTAVDTSARESGNSNETGNTLVSPYPGVPANLTATPTTTVIELDWADNSDLDLDYYKVYRGTITGGPYTQIASDVSVSAFTDSTAILGTQYYYVVAAVDTGAYESGYSNEIASQLLGSSTTDNFFITEDSFVHKNGVTNNYGANGWLKIRGPGSDREHHSYLKFTVTGVGTVTSAKLKLYSDTMTNDFHVKSVSDNTWTEGTITWNNKPAVGSTITTVTNVAANSWIEIDVTSAVSGNGTITFVLQGTVDSIQRCYSKTDAARKPVLEITHQ